MSNKFRLLGNSKFDDLEILYTTNGDNPETNGIVYQRSF